MWQVPNLYALAAYDMGDFVEVLEEVDNIVLEELYTVLTFPNSKHDTDTKRINKFAAHLVKNRLEKKGLKILDGATLKAESETPQDSNYRFKHLSEEPIG